MEILKPMSTSSSFLVFLCKSISIYFSVNTHTRIYTQHEHPHTYTHMRAHTISSTVCTLNLVEQSLLRLFSKLFTLKPLQLSKRCISFFFCVSDRINQGANDCSAGVISKTTNAPQIIKFRGRLLITGADDYYF